MKNAYCKKCRENAKIYYRGKWYVSCGCAKTQEYNSRQEAIDAWDGGERIELPAELAG